MRHFRMIILDYTGLSANFEVGGASAGVGGEIDYFLIGILHKMY